MAIIVVPDEQGNHALYDDVLDMIVKPATPEEESTGRIKFRGKEYTFAPSGSAMKAAAQGMGIKVGKDGEVDVSGVTGLRPEDKKELIEMVKAERLSRIKKTPVQVPLSKLGEAGLEQARIGGNITRQQIADFFINNPEANLGVAGGILGEGVGTIFGGTPGGIAGSLAGGASGAAIGAIKKEMERNIDPDAPVDMKRVREAAVAAAMRDLAFGTLGQGVAKGANLGWKGFKAGLGRVMSLFKEELTPEVQSFIRYDAPDFPVSMGQTTGSPVTQLTENLVNYIKKGRLTARQDQIFRDMLKAKTTSLGPEQIAEQVIASLKKGQSNLTGEINELYGQARTMAAQNKYQLPVTTPLNPAAPAGLGPTQVNPPIPAGFTPPKMIEGPVEYVNTRAAAKEMIDSIKGEVPKDFTDAYAELKKVVDGDDVVTFNEALDLKRSSGSAGFGDYLRNVNQGAYVKLNSAVAQDIEESIFNPKFDYPDPSGLYNTYSEGLEKSRLLHKLYGDTPDINALINIKGQTGQVNVDNILGDAVSLRNAVQAADNPEAMKGFLKERYLNRFVEGAGELKTKLDRTKLYDTFMSKENKHVREQLFGQDETDAIGRLIKSMEYFSPEKVKAAGQTALALHTGFAGLTLAGGLWANQALDKPFPTGAITSGAILLSLGSSWALTRNVFMNPEVAKIAADLAKLPVKSAAAQSKTRALFQALKYTELPLIDSVTGERVGTMMPDSKGKLMYIDPKKQ